jgi:4-hydroxybenzoate polyprenyltransferase
MAMAEETTGIDARGRAARRPSARAQAAGLVLACHPVPAAAVTGFVAALTVSAGNGVATCLVATLAVLTGQLSIGWSNDLLDAERDTLSGRSGKPIAAGLLPRRTAVVALACALGLSVPLSLALGWRAGVVQLLTVACGWVYNLGVKSTVWSPLPYAVAFGTLPAVASLALPDHPWPAWWALAAGALVGVAAHFGNVLPDLADDAATGVRGLPHRLTRVACAGVAAGLALVAVLLVAVAPGGGPSLLGWLAVLTGLVVAAATLVVVRQRSSTEAAFYAIMLLAAVGVALLAANGAWV